MALLTLKCCEKPLHSLKTESQKRFLPYSLVFISTKKHLDTLYAIHHFGGVSRLFLLGHVSKHFFDE